MVDRPIQAKEYYGRRNSEIEGQELDQQGIVETHKVSAIGVCPKFIKGNKQTLEFCKADFNGNEIAIAAAFFVALGEPVFSDKNNKKYIVYGDGCRAAGVDLVDFNPLVVKGAANAVIGREVQSGKRDAADNSSAVIAQATRLIARKEITDNEDNIFTVVDGIKIRFGKQISVISGCLKITSHF